MAFHLQRMVHKYVVIVDDFIFSLQIFQLLICMSELNSIYQFIMGDHAAARRNILILESFIFQPRN